MLVGGADDLRRTGSAGDYFRSYLDSLCVSLKASAGCLLGCGWTCCSIQTRRRPLPLAITSCPRWRSWGCSGSSGRSAAVDGHGCAIACSAASVSVRSASFRRRCTEPAFHTFCKCCRCFR